MLNVQRLRVLRAVAASGSFSRAAEALSYTQSAVSQAIATLETEAGATLHRTRPPRRAADGRRWRARGTRRPHPRRPRGRRDGPGHDRRRARRAPTDGLVPDRGLDADAPCHREIRRRPPGGRAEPRGRRAGADRPAPAHRRVRPRAVFEFRDGGEKLGAGLRRLDLLEDLMYVALPAGHPLADEPRLRLEDLRGESWVQTSAASPCARHVVRSCHGAGFEPNVSFESDDYQTVQGLVAAGVGVALIPQLALSSVRDDIRVRALHPRGPVRNVVAATPRGGALPPPSTCSRCSTRSRRLPHARAVVSRATAR